MSREQYAQAKRVFLQALEVAPAEREAYVRSECGEDEELCAEILSLLNHHDTQTLLGTPRTDTRLELDPGAEGSPSAPRNMLHLAGQSVGEFSRQLGPLGHLALGIAVATILLTVVGYAASSFASHRIRELRIGTLAKLLDSNIEAMDVWIVQEKARVETGARDAEFVRIVEQLVELGGQLAEPTGQTPEPGEQASIENLRTSPLQAELRADLHESFEKGPPRFALWDTRYRTLSDWSSDGTGIGVGVTPYGAAVLARVFAGQTVMQMPGFHDPITKGYPTDQRQHHIGVIAPVKNRKREVIAALLVYGIGAEDRFQRLLSILKIGDSGEMYAFNAEGLMISESRFNPQLREIGLLEDQPDSKSCLAVRLSDPGGDMTRGFRPTEDLSVQELTKMARHAVRQHDGEDGFGYRDYRGVLVVGAWRWLEDHDFGVALEVDYTDAFRELHFVQWGFGALYGLFAIAVACVVGSYAAVRRSQRRLHEARRLGPYTLGRLLGEGGMGQVFLARHALLKRPTAVKILKPEVVNRTTLAWFEREVQLASQLTHPNTIEIYDYGRTDDGVFYYAMEYLSGITLEDLARRHGPLPAARCVHLWRQICLSLREAHQRGLIHRDIKPQNIMVCRRGGEADVIKVLDFGLAKDIAAPASDISVAALRLAGTPRYMAPERIGNPLDIDNRVDIYACGGVAFKLLTGEDVYPAENDIDALLQAWRQPVPRPSQRLGRLDGSRQAIDPALDDLIHACLAKSPDDRPSDISQVLKTLDQLQFDPPWTDEAASRWWEAHAEEFPSDE